MTWLNRWLHRKLKEAMEKKKILLRKGGHQFELKLGDKEKGGGKSMTVPNDSYSIKELLDRSIQGIDMGRGRDAIYGLGDADFDDHDLEKLAKMDHNERSEVLERNAEQLKVARAQLAADRAAKKKAEDEERSRLKKENENSQSQSYKYDEKKSSRKREEVPPEPHEAGKRSEDQVADEGRRRRTNEAPRDER